MQTRNRKIIPTKRRKIDNKQQTSFPLDVYRNIMRYMTPESIGMFMQTSKQMYSLVEETFKNQFGDTIRVETLSGEKGEILKHPIARRNVKKIFIKNLDLSMYPPQGYIPDKVEEIYVYHMHDAHRMTNMCNFELFFLSGHYEKIKSFGVIIGDDHSANQTMRFLSKYKKLKMSMDAVVTSSIVSRVTLSSMMSFFDNVFIECRGVDIPNQWIYCNRDHFEDWRPDGEDFE